MDDGNGALTERQVGKQTGRHRQVGRAGRQAGRQAACSQATGRQRDIQ